MQQKRLDQYKVLVFDVYGTLIVSCCVVCLYSLLMIELEDWNSGMYEALLPLLGRAKSGWSKNEALIALINIEVDKIMQHPGWAYPEILKVSHKALGEGLGVTTTEEEDALFASSLAKWKPFPDTVAALAKLKKYYKLVVLSNVDNKSFHTFTRPVLEEGGGTFDLVLTAQDIGSYKPDPANLHAALKAIETQFDISKEQVLVTAHALTADHEPANALGIASAWIERDGAVTHGSSTATYDFTFKTLGDMATAREDLAGS